MAQGDPRKLTGLGCREEKGRAGDDTTAQAPRPGGASDCPDSLGFISESSGSHQRGSSKIQLSILKVFPWQLC